MALLFLPNTAGDRATAQDNTGSGATATGYDVKNLIAGPRQASNGWRSTASSGASGVGYQIATDTDIDHIVIARADWLLTENTMRVKGRKRDSGGTWTDISGFDKNPIVAADLIGPKAQDLVIAVDVDTSLRGVGISADPVAGTEAVQISKLYGAIAFTFDPLTVPSREATWEDLPPGTYYEPLLGSRPYEVERRFTLTFEAVTMAQIENFKAIPQLFYWPFFLYDQNADLWKWKLEHVILEGFEVSVRTNLYYDLTINFLRLRHYD